ncbi:hypothetical protein [Streptomyces ipomoeae]|uniref:hypothetical protein n=1 Tax=Streptomyces ipomoeae TaxID=103232 RepID=UPI0011474DBF|nr:hypothetical protein [Streptomyces ipomoeae]MDX2937006.1 hypothetical protein [Streptomyces ipomoeae]TQE26164.1 hypothetical protein SipoB123_14770 [Streptomyces ipomoeae]
MQTTETPATTAVVTREPAQPGRDTFGDADSQGDDFSLLIDGEHIGGTYWVARQDIADGERWGSCGLVGVHMRFRTREDAEQVQANTHLSKRTARAADRAAGDAFPSAAPAVVA